MEYNSFYGGRRGASFVIVKSFKTEQEMAEAFVQGGKYKTVNYDEYVIIDTENKNDITNGRIYRRGYNYANDENHLGGAEYIGQIVGPAGLGPHAEVIEKSDVHQKWVDAEGSTDHLDYRHGEGTYDTGTNDLVPGAKGEQNERTFDDDTDKIHWEYFSLRDNHQLETTCYIGFQVPYTVVDFFTKAVDPYNAQGNYADMTDAQRQAISDEHPFYEQWELSIPKGVKGDVFKNFKLYTPTKQETMNDVDGKSHTLGAGRTVLIYEYWVYDNKKEGEKTTLYLGEYEVIDDITIDEDGTVTVSYKSNREDTVFDKRIQWIDEISLTQEGHFTVVYNNGASNYETDLTWVRRIDLSEDGTVTITYNNKTTEDLESQIKWLVNSSYDATTGKITFTYNTGDKEVYEYNQIEETAIPVIGEYAYHLLVYYSSIDRRGEISYNDKEGWVDLGIVKDYNGILVGTNIDSTDQPELDTPLNALEYLNREYPEGITEGYSVGKVVTIGTTDVDKKFYAFDYEKKEWIYLGTTSGAAGIKSVIAGPEDEETAKEADMLPVGSLWFVVEGDE